MESTQPSLTIIYVSSARRLMKETELETLLAKARERNGQLGITGLLLYRDGNFMQLLEGPEAAVREVYAAIEKDDRHHQVIMLASDHDAEREFSEWTMAYGRLDDAGWQALMQRISPAGRSVEASVAKEVMHDFWTATI